MTKNKPPNNSCPCGSDKKMGISFNPNPDNDLRPLSDKVRIEVVSTARMGTLPDTGLYKTQSDPWWRWHFVIKGRKIF